MQKKKPWSNCRTKLKIIGYYREFDKSKYDGVKLRKSALKQLAAIEISKKQRV